VSQPAHQTRAANQPHIEDSDGALQLALLPEPFTMHRGGVLERVQVAYETWGKLDAERNNAVLLFTGLSPGAHAGSSDADSTPGWWEYMLGPGKPIDTNRWFVVCVNSLGSCFGSTGPGSIDPRTGKPYNLEFPELAVEDIAKAGRETVRLLGVKRLRAVVGPSLGGMTALAYSVLYGDELDHLITISAACRAHPFAIAMRSLQREVIRADPAWKGGDYAAEAEPTEGMRLARKVGLMSYRSAEEWRHRFGRERIANEYLSGGAFAPEFQVESYLEHNARNFSGRFDANSYLYLSRAMDWFDLADYGGSVEAALARVGARRSLVIGVESDVLFPVDQQREIAEGLRQAGRVVEFASLPSVQGHDAFLIDEERFAPLVRDFLARA
jgi:homoserine O-acetyltransferase